MRLIASSGPKETLRFLVVEELELAVIFLTAEAEPVARGFALGLGFALDLAVAGALGC